MTLFEMQIEQAAIDAEQLASELEAREAKGAAFMARGLRRMARDVRLSLVVEVSHEALTRLHLKLESAMRVASAALLSTLAQPDDDQPPISQRPTIPPPPMFSAKDLFSRDLDSEEPMSERDKATVKPPALSEIPPVVIPRQTTPGVRRVPPTPAASEVRSVSGMRPKHGASIAREDEADGLDEVAVPGSRRGR